jgi:hypothetical protein
VSVVNRRNAVIGWAVWNIWKSVAKMKARRMSPSFEGRRPNKALIAAALAAAAGAAVLLRGRQSEE